MRYHEDDFLRLMSAAEEQGGVLAETPCKGAKFRIKQPNGERMKYKEFRTHGCGLDTVFILPYQKPGGKDTRGGNIPGGTGTVAVCAVGDDIGRWPRFRGVIQEDQDG
jgi:hypothetical protein